VPFFEAKAVGRKLLDHPGFAMFLLPTRGSGSSRHHPLLQTCVRFASGQWGAHPTDLLLQPGSTVGIPYVRLPLVSIMGMVGKPRGHGLVRWHSKKIEAPPRVDSRLLEEPDDLSRAIDAMRLAFELAQSRPMKELASMLWPRPSVFRHRDDIERWIAGACDSGYHASGTVPMGKSPGLDAAVDPHGRVFGIENLYVADASVMPTIPSSNIHLATLMIAERMAEWLRDGD
jgi:choline dehydrogenase